jgi:hypothetical protein
MVFLPVVDGIENLADGSQNIPGMVGDKAVERG